MKQVVKRICFCSIPSRPLKWLCRFASIVLLAVVLFGAFGMFMVRSIRQQNARQRESAFEELKKNAICPPEYLQIKKGAFKYWDDACGKVYEQEKYGGTRVQLSKTMSLVFLADSGEKTDGKIAIREKKIRLDSDSYARLFDYTPHEMTQGIIMKVTASGRGRLQPLVYYVGGFDTGIKDSESARNQRVSSWVKKDHYFYFPPDKKYETLNIGLQIRGFLEISDITVYQGKDTREPKIGILTAKIEEVSEIPDAEKSPYPDCLYTLKMKTLDIEKLIHVPKEFILIAPAFKNRKIRPEALWKQGEMIHLSMIPFHEAPERIRRIQQSDTLDDFNSERYALMDSIQPVRVKKIRTGIMSESTFGETKTYVSGYDKPQNPPLTPQALADRRNRIAAAYRKIKTVTSRMPRDVNEINLEYNRVWQKNQKNYYPFQDKIFLGKQGKSYFALGPIQFIVTTDVTKQVLAVKELSDYMLRHGVFPVIVICPQIYDISARFMNPEFSSMPDFNAAYVAERLLEQGVETLYFSDELLKHALDHELLYRYPLDGHPAWGTQLTAAKEIGRYLKKNFPEICTPCYRPEMFTETQARYDSDFPDFDSAARTGRGNDAAKSSKNKVMYYPVYLLNGKPIKPDPQAELMLYGNSFLMSPQPDYLLSLLTHELGCGFREIYRPLSHPLTTLLLDLLEHPEMFLKGCKVCVIYLSVGSFYHKCWNIREIDRIKRQNSTTRPRSGKTES